MSLDYSKLSEVIVTTQEEMDMIPEDFKGRIYIKSKFCISVNKRYYWRVVAWGNSSVEARETAPLKRGKTAPLKRGKTAPL